MIAGFGSVDAVETLTQNEARNMVVERLDAMAKEAQYDCGGFVILDEHTIEKPWGWVFFYDSRKHVETGDVQFAIAGNAPYIVNRLDRSIHVTGTAKAIEHYISEYEDQIQQT